MELTPRRYARYMLIRPDAIEVQGRAHIWDTRHYDDDHEVFWDEGGRQWRRVAVTQREYRSTKAAQAELDAMAGWRETGDPLEDGSYPHPDAQDHPHWTADAEDRMNRGGW